MRTLSHRFLRIVLVLLVNSILCQFRASTSAAEKSLPREGQPVDVVPYGYPLPSDDGKSYGVIWEDPRDIVKVVVSYAKDTPDSIVQQAKLQYWQSQWPHRLTERDSYPPYQVLGNTAFSLWTPRNAYILGLMNKAN